MSTYMLKTQDNEILCFNHAICAASVGVSIEIIKNYNTLCCWCLSGNPPDSVIAAMKERKCLVMGEGLEAGEAN